MMEIIGAMLDRINAQEAIEIGPEATSLDLLRAVYRNAGLPLSTRLRAASIAIPYESPKLQVTAVVQEHDLATLLDRRLRKIEEMRNGNRAKLMEPPATLEQIVAPVEVKPPKPHINDR